MATVETEKGPISAELFDFALLVDGLVDGQPVREREWLLKCCACFADNDVTTKTDLIGLDMGDLFGEELGLTGGQRAWVRRCVDKANKDMVKAFARRGEEAAPQGDGNAIKALVETIKNEEVRTNSFSPIMQVAFQLQLRQVRVHVNLHAKIPEIKFEGEYLVRTCKHAL